MSNPPLDELILQSVADHPTDLVSFVATTAGVSRQAVHSHLARLIESGQILKTGRKRGTRYFPGDGPRLHLRLNVEPGLEEHVVYQTYIEPRLSHLPQNLRDICAYGCTEMINNVIDHAEARTLRLNLLPGDRAIQVQVSDDGIGIFRKIADALHLQDRREAVLHLSKGKFTTDPARHTGEGIFFTSRAFDRFTLSSNRLRFLRFEADDWLLSSSDVNKGTEVIMEIALHTERTLRAIFDAYTDPATHDFDRTQVVVSLARLEGERYISRSQAKRVLLGLERFRRVALDFRGVQAVGQGFVDEVFRVYPSRHPEIAISYVNANDDVEFMIRRSMPSVPPAR